MTMTRTLGVVGIAVGLGAVAALTMSCSDEAVGKREATPSSLSNRFAKHSVKVLTGRDGAIMEVPPLAVTRLTPRDDDARGKAERLAIEEASKRATPELEAKMLAFQRA